MPIEKKREVYASKISWQLENTAMVNFYRSVSNDWYSEAIKKTERRRGGGREDFWNNREKKKDTNKQQLQKTFKSNTAKRTKTTWKRRGKRKGRMHHAAAYSTPYKCLSGYKYVLKWQKHQYEVPYIQVDFLAYMKIVSLWWSILGCWADQTYLCHVHCFCHVHLFFHRNWLPDHPQLFPFHPDRAVPSQVHHKNCWIYWKLLEKLVRGIMTSRSVLKY